MLAIHSDTQDVLNKSSSCKEHPPTLLSYPPFALSIRDHSCEVRLTLLTDLLLACDEFPRINSKHSPPPYFNTHIIDFWLFCSVPLLLFFSFSSLKVTVAKLPAVLFLEGSAAVVVAEVILSNVVK